MEIHASQLGKFKTIYPEQGETDPEGFKVSAVYVRSVLNEYRVVVAITKNGDLYSPPLEYSPSSPGKLAHLENYLCEYFDYKTLRKIMQNLLGEKFPTLYETVQNGFALDATGEIAVYGTTKFLLDKNGVELPSLPFEYPEGVLPDIAGQVVALRKWLKGGVVRQVMLMAALAAPILPLLEDEHTPNILVATIGRSSTGKTTISRVCAGLFSKPKDVTLKFNSTPLAMLENLNNVMGVCRVFDDTSTDGLTDKGRRDYRSFIYSLAEGQSRQRIVNRRGKFGHTETEEWRTTIFLNAERSIYATCADKTEGVAARLIELEVDSNDLFDSQMQCREIDRSMKTIYGALGRIYMSGLLSAGKEAVEDCFYKTMQKLSQKYPHEDAVLSRRQTTTALIAVAGSFANKLLVKLFDTDLVVEYLEEVARRNLEDFTNAKPENLAHVAQQRLWAIGNDKCSDTLKDNTMIVSSKIFKDELGRLAVDKTKQSEIKKEMERLGYLVLTRNKEAYANHTRQGKSIAGYKIAEPKEEE